MQTASSRVTELQGGNFQVWSFELKMYLMERFAHHYIARTHEQAVLLEPEQDPARRAVAAATHEAIAFAAIGQTVAKSLQRIIRNAATARDAFVLLEDHCREQARSRAFYLERSLDNFRMHDLPSADAFLKELTTMDKLRDELAVAGVEVSDARYARILLHALPPSLDSLSSLLFREGADAARIRGDVLSELQRREFASAPPPAPVLVLQRTPAAVEPREDSRRHHHRGRHDRREVRAGDAAPSRPTPKIVNGKKYLPRPNDQERKQFDGECYNCGRRGHRKRECRQPTRDSSPSVNMVVETTMMLRRVENSSPPLSSTRVRQTKVDFLVDGGATSHIVNDLDLLHDVKECDVTFAHIMGDVRASHKGKFRGTTLDGRRIVLQEVYYIPSARANLLSVKNYSVLVGAGTLTLQVGDQSFTCPTNSSGLGTFTLVPARVPDVTRGLDDEREPAPATTLLLSNADRKLTYAEFHHLYGHVADETLQHIPGCPTRPADFQCSPCLACKLHRASRPARDTRAGEVLERLHADIVGPITPPGLNNEKYALIVTDECSALRTGSCLRTRAEAGPASAQIVGDLQRQTGKLARFWRTDGAPELSTAQLRRLVTVEQSAPYTAQQNGLAERSNGIVIPLSRVLLHASGLPVYLWPWAFRHAIFILNRVLNLSREAIPMDKAGVHWDAKRVRPFGAPCVFVDETLAKSLKFHPRARKGQYLGEAPGYRAAYVFCEGRVYISDNVAFFNGMFLAPSPSAIADAAGNRREKENQNEVVLEWPQEENPQEEENQVYVPPPAQDELPVLPPPSPPRVREEVKQPELQQDAPRRSGRQRVPSSRLVNAIEQGLMSVTTPDKSLIPLTDAEIKEAIKKELDALEKNETWEMVLRKMLPSGTMVFDFTLPVHRKSSGKPKARLCLRGDQEKNRPNGYAPTADLSIAKLILAHAAALDLDVRIIDVSNAYTYALMPPDMPIYMRNPYGDDRVVCKLKKSLYGLTISGKLWYHHLRDLLLEIGFKQSQHCSCLFFNKEGVVCLIYVDDILLVGGKAQCDNIQNKIAAKLKIKVKVPPCCYLGLEIYKTSNSICVSQSSYIDKLLYAWRMHEAHPHPDCTPISPGDLDPKNQDDARQSSDNPHLPTAVGQLLYLSGATRPDVAFATQRISSLQSVVPKTAWIIFKKTLQYVKRTRGYAIHFPIGVAPLNINAFSDADFAQDKRSRKSISGSLICLNDTAFTWMCKQQPFVAVSTCEAETAAATATCRETIYFDKILRELRPQVSTPPVVSIDNKATVDICNTNKSTGARKHIDVQQRYVADATQKKLITVSKIPGLVNPADMLTKPLPASRIRNLMQLVQIM
jgi:hypothetical protein